MHPNNLSSQHQVVRNGLFIVGGGILVSIICAYWLCYQNDHFGQGIVIPPGMKVEEPIGNFRPAWTKQSDEEFRLMNDPSSTDHAEGDAINNLELPTFGGPRRALLLRHLATSCKWRVSEERGKIFAVRREVDEDRNWASHLNGYIYRTIEPSGHSSERTVIGLDGPIYENIFQAPEFLAKPGLVHIPFERSDNYEQESYFCDKFGQHVLEIFEETPSKARRFTNSQLIMVKAELDGLNASKVAASRGFDPSLMPAFSIGPGRPELKVIMSRSGGGIYFVDAFVNPGEPGKTYLKVFEATRNTRLSEGRVSQDSLEYIGWSDNQNETFFYGSLIDIGEGNWHTLYPARFELWFLPADQSKPERKLLERTYTICGWER